MICHDHTHLSPRPGQPAPHAPDPRCCGRQDRHRRHRLAARSLRPRAADGTGARAVLRRDGALQERAEHDDDDLRRARRHHGHLGPRRLLDRLRRRRRLGTHRRPPAALRAAGPGRRERGQLVDHPDHPVRDVPGPVLRDHRSPGLRRHRRPGQVRRLDRVRLGLDRAGLRADRALGLRLRPRGPHRGLAGQPGRDDRLRRRDGCRDLLGRIRPGARPGRGHPGRFRQRRDAAAQPDPGDAGCRPALVRLVRLQRGFRTRRQPHGGGRVRDHHLRRRRGLPRLAADGARSATATPPRSVPHRDWSPAWSPSPRAEARSRPWAPW